MTDDAISGRRVLVVEDEAMVSMFIEDALQMLGCEVVGIAARVDEAMMLIEQQQIDAAVLDINLGRGRDSYPIAETLAARGVPFVFSTGYGEDGLREGFRDRPVLAKPFRMQDLAEVLEGMLATR